METLNIDVNGAGNLDLSGKAENLDIKINGGGLVNAYDMESDTANATINGMGQCKLRVEKALNAKIDGAGAIYYKGNATVKSSISGVGEIKKAEGE